MGSWSTNHSAHVWAALVLILWTVGITCVFHDWKVQLALFAWGGLGVFAGWWDIRTKRLPNWLTALNAAVSMGLGVLVGESASDALVGAISGVLAVLIVKLLAELITGVHSIGMGDVKLMFSLGVFTGLSGISILLGLSALLSLPYSLYAKRHSASQTIPFGPFLVAGAMGAVILNTLTNSQVAMYF